MGDQFLFTVKCGWVICMVIPGSSFGFSWRKVGVLLTSYRILFLHVSHLNLLISISEIT